MGADKTTMETFWMNSAEARDGRMQLGLGWQELFQQPHSWLSWGIKFVPIESAGDDMAGRNGGGQFTKDEHGHKVSRRVGGYQIGVGC